MAGITDHEESSHTAVLYDSARYKDAFSALASSPVLA